MKVKSKVGYTHTITWQERVTSGSLKGKVVTKSFPTTKDAVQWHLHQMKKSDLISNIEVTKF